MIVMSDDDESPLPCYCPGGWKHGWGMTLLKFEVKSYYGGRVVGEVDPSHLTF